VKRTAGGRFYSPVARLASQKFVIPFVALDALGPLRDRVWADERSRFGGSMSLSPQLFINGAVDGRGS
jgi:hypothetical protein